MRYVRKPIEIEAILWNGYDGVFEIVQEMVKPAVLDRQSNDTLAIFTLNGGTKLANFGDYVCRDVHEGVVFVVNGEGFQHMYVPADDDMIEEVEGEVEDE